MQRHLLFAAAAAVALICCGCSALDPVRDPTTYYVLATALEAGDTPPTHAGLPPSLVIGIAPVTLPKYLDRPEIVRREGLNRIEISEYERWGEPLEGSVNRVLAANLSAFLQEARVVGYPGAALLRPSYVIWIGIERFEASEGEQARLVARWALRRADGQPVLAVRETTIQHPFASHATSDAVVAMSKALASLSAEIADAVRETVRQG